MCEPKNFYMWLLQFFALLGLLALILWLLLRPKHPTCTIVDISVPSPDSGNTNSSNENGVLTYVLEIQNPNQDSSISYNNIFLSFYNGQDTIGGRTIPSFRQGKGRTREFADHVDVNMKAWRAFRSTLSDATAQLKVGLVTEIRYNTWGIKSKHHGMNLQGLIPIGSDGKIKGKKKIKLRHASKKWRVKFA